MWQMPAEANAGCRQPLLPRPIIRLPLLLLLLIIVASYSLAQSPLSFRFSDIIAKRVRVVVDPIRVSVENGTLKNDRKRPVCVLALHRDECHGPQIRAGVRIGWQDRLCFVWRCLRAEGLAWLVHSCWAGSAQSPILLIDRDGCTREGSMISTPSYRPLNQSAHSQGWLTVRLPHLDHIHLSCAVTFCPICDRKCRAQTPPTKCADLTGQQQQEGEEWWRKEMEVEGGSRNMLEEMCQEKQQQSFGMDVSCWYYTQVLHTLGGLFVVWLNLQ